jgi:hypothetical protein
MKGCIIRGGCDLCEIKSDAGDFSMFEAHIVQETTNIIGVPERVNQKERYGDVAGEVEKILDDFPERMNSVRKFFKYGVGRTSVGHFALLR